MVLTILLAHLLRRRAAMKVRRTRWAPRAPRRGADAALAPRAPLRASTGPPPARLSDAARSAGPTRARAADYASTAPRWNTPDGIPGSVLTGPFPVGPYAAALRDRLRGFTRVQVFGEVFGFKAGRAKVWFELRDACGRAAVLDVARGLRQAAARDAGRRGAGRRRGRVRLLPRARAPRRPGSRSRSRGCGSPARATCSPSSSSCAGGCTPRGCSRRRRRCRGRGCRAASASSRASPARRATTCWPGLRRRGWAGRLVWGFAPVQDRHAAPAITRALQDLAACEEVEVIVVARGGGSLADLFAFCDETLCRTVALLRVPVISRVGHHTDRTLLDDVAAVACSTPTHAAETAVPGRLHRRPRARSRPTAARLERQGRRAVLDRARTLARLSRAPGAPRRPPPHPPAPAAARAARGDPPRDRRRRAHDARARRALVAQGDRRGRRRRPRRAARAPTPPRWTAPRPPRWSAAAATWTASCGHARRPRPPAHARTRLRAARGPAGRAGDERRGAPARQPSRLTVRLHEGGRVDALAPEDDDARRCS